MNEKVRVITFVIILSIVLLGAAFFITQSITGKNILGENIVLLSHSSPVPSASPASCIEETELLDCMLEHATGVCNIVNNWFCCDIGTNEASICCDPDPGDIGGYLKCP